jgi:hypothetical protein
MKHKLVLVFVLTASLMAYGQGRGRGGSMGQGQGMGQGRGSGMGQMGQGQVGQGQGMGQGQMDRTQQQDRMQQRERMHQGPLTDKQMQSGSWRMLEQKTGMTSDQLKQLYDSSGVKNYGQFVSAVVVSRNLNLDTNQVLTGLKSKSLGGVLQDMGISSAKAKEEIKSAHKQIKDADKQKS